MPAIKNRQRTSHKVRDVYNETPLRSLVKSVEYRALALISDVTIIFAITGRTGETASLVIFTNLSSTIWYYLHERFWNKYKGLEGTSKNKMLQNIHLKRDFIKALTFRMIILCADFIIASLITSNAKTAIGIIVFTNLASTIFYYFHEMAWDLIRWGMRVKKA